MLPFEIQREFHVLHRFPCRTFIVQETCWSLFTCLPFGQGHQWRVHPDARQPSREFKGAAQGAQVSRGSTQSILKRIF